MAKEPPLYSDTPIDSPQAVVQVMADTLKDYDREVFAIINLRPDLKPINVNIVSVGALDQSLVHPREAIKSMVLSNAVSVMMVHNHTTGSMSPSKDDIAVTDRMAQFCGLLGIKLIDHIIVGPGKDYYSFHEKGVLPLPNIKYETDINSLEIGGLKMAETPTAESTKARVVSFTVAECSEFHNMGEFHENIATVKEAMEIFEKIPPERMSAIPAVGIRVADKENPQQVTEMDVIVGNHIDLQLLEYIPEIAENKAAQFAIAEMLHAMPEATIYGEVPEEIQKNVLVIESKENQTAQLKEITDKLEQGVQDVFQSDSYKELLNVMARMPHYSINNQILIAMQTGGQATMCQSFTGWKQMGRYVKSGEKGIKIFAPAPYTIQKEMDKLDAQGKTVLDSDGEPLKETQEVTVNAFKVVNTFDISQTDGKEIPTIGVDELSGDVDRFSGLMAALTEVCPVPIAFEDIPGDAKGYYSQTEKRIAIQEGMSEVQTVKTVLHEMAHQKLHAKEVVAKSDDKSRRSKEVEAESVAFVVCQHYGIDTSDYSFGYVAGWSAGKETPELKTSLQTIRDAASQMIHAIDDQLEEHSKAKETQKSKPQKSRVQDLIAEITKAAEENGFTVEDSTKSKSEKTAREKKPPAKKKEVTKSSLSRRSLRKEKRKRQRLR